MLSSREVGFFRHSLHILSKAIKSMLAGSQEYYCLLAFVLFGERTNEAVNIAASAQTAATHLGM